MLSIRRGRHILLIDRNEQAAFVWRKLIWLLHDPGVRSR